MAGRLPFNCAIALARLGIPAACQCPISQDEYGDLLLTPLNAAGVEVLLAIVPDDVTNSVKTEIGTTLSRSIPVGARPLTEAEWRTLLTEAGFIDLEVRQAPMHLLKMSRILADEGPWRTLKFVRNVIADGDARRRVLDMRAVFNKHAGHIRGIALVGR
ncbi:MULTISPECIES: hypothetical protein [unclassified Devosia]|uniref:hypothetical protein n=1 Tax=unclassified Devosia TaxID=196773 RepID=UPI001AC0294D|nr:MULTISPECIES: hypothetical protein [unclassified Devosia]MBN9304787.1 hypothetical protein [Devosia sp.]